MSEQGRNLVYESGQWQVHLGRRELLAQGVAVPIGARAFEIIEVLVRSANEMVAKDDLMDRVWPGAMVGENTLQVHISAIRKAFGPDRTMLKTASGRGYRLIGSWTAKRPTARAEPVDPTRPAETAEPVLGNLPAAAGALIGRAFAVQHLRDLLSAYRIVTLTGAGGIGKTSLALTVAGGAVGEFGDGGWLVELVSVSDPALVPPMVAQVLRLGVGGGDVTAESIARAIGAKNLLLVLDNCEHVIDVVSNLVEMVVHRCPAVTILATSREALRVQGELVYRVPPLEVPGEDQVEEDKILGYSAPALLGARISASNSDFSPDARSLKAIAAVCRRLDGIPLAIEFAAARAATLGVEHVLSRLDDRFGLLTSGRRTALPKHRTLRATLDWSYELLSGPERLLLRRLAIFEGGFSLEAVRAVTASKELDLSEITDVFSNLVVKSLVTLVSGATDERFRLLETTRVYAREKLAESGETGQLAKRHADYYRGLFRGLDYRPTATPATLADVGNARAALEWCFGVNGDTAIGIALASVAAPTLLAMSLLAECQHWTGLAIRLLGNVYRGTQEEMHLQACFGLSSMHMHGQSDAARMALDQSLAIAEQRGDVLNQFGLLGMLHRFHIREGQFKIALDYAKRRRVLAEVVEDPGCMALAQMVLGRSLHMMGDIAGARAELEASLQNWSIPHHTSSIYLAYDRGFLPGTSLARTLWLQGYPAQAVECAREAIESAQRIEKPQSLVLVLLWAASVYLWTGDLQNAESHTDLSMSHAEGLSLGALLEVGRCRKAELAIYRGHANEGVAALRAGLEKIRALRIGILETELIISLAQGLGATGQFAEGLTLTDETIQRVEILGEISYLPELLRVKGGLLLSMPRPQSDEAETCLIRSLELGRAQGARAWELRTTVDLAALLRSRGEAERARMLLRPVLERFVEGLDTSDVQAATQLLATLI